MTDIRTGKDLKEYPILEEPKLYIYAMLNDVGKVKIGHTKNIQKRYENLCGSNGQGIKIIKVCCSFSTYLYVIENILHNKFKKYRISGTEWFYNKEDITGELLFKNVVNEMKLLFSSESFKKCNSLRKELYERGVI